MGYSVKTEVELHTASLFCSEPAKIGQMRSCNMYEHHVGEEDVVNKNAHVHKVEILLSSNSQHWMELCGHFILEHYEQKLALHPQRGGLVTFPSSLSSKILTRSSRKSRVSRLIDPITSIWQ